MSEASLLLWGGIIALALFTVLTWGCHWLILRQERRRDLGRTAYHARLQRHVYRRS